MMEGHAKAQREVGLQLGDNVAHWPPGDEYHHRRGLKETESLSSRRAGHLVGPIRISGELRHTVADIAPRNPGHCVVDTRFEEPVVPFMIEKGRCDDNASTKESIFQ